MTEILATLVALTLLAGYVVYYKSVKDGVRPNTTLWTLWTFGSLLELASYMGVTGDWAKNVLPFVCSLACITLYIYFLSHGKFQKLTFGNILIIFADLMAMILWYVTESALVANLAMQVSTVISFIPMYIEVFDDEENEKQLPWIIWSVTYALDIILVITRWEKWGDLAYPLTNFVLHFGMWMLIYFHLKKGNKKYEIEDHLYVSKSKIAGLGLFTSKDIKKGELAFTLKGKRIKFQPKTKEEALKLPNIFGVDKGISIDPVFPYDHINHKCVPNLGIDSDAISFIALVDISAGSELTFDYSISEHSAWEMTCSCGEENCRKTIKSIEKLPINFFASYYPYIPSYFEKVYFEKYISENP
jgi:hypothetical protein